ncbi:eCIS core domain-containing protein [Streptoalloteichus hindustanus]|uniref:eCIS core domain-containing protein n=1 Tax=Streptoalloteichus hindustanus TaxID=2017 RepID=UPI00135630E7|nr:DUF4157 domain-containing protein [Streptoalloteichus hindustanus]
MRGVLQQPGTPLPAHLRSDMESQFDADFSDVRVHADSLAHRSARGVDALAYTSGSHVVLGAGVDATNRAVLRHELSHVLQQREGPVPGVPTGDGLVMSTPDDAGERAAHATASEPGRGTTGRTSGPSPATSAGMPVVQRIRESPRERVPRYTPAEHVFWAGPSYAKPQSRFKGGTGVDVRLGPGAGKSGLGSPPRRGECTAVEDLTALYNKPHLWIKGHLLNDNVGGPGESRNLTPLSHNANMDMKNRFEKPVKDAVDVADSLAAETAPQGGYRHNRLWGVHYQVEVVGQKWPGEKNKALKAVGERVRARAELVHRDRVPGAADEPEPTRLHGVLPTGVVEIECALGVGLPTGEKRTGDGSDSGEPPPKRGRSRGPRATKTSTP